MLGRDKLGGRRVGIEVVVLGEGGRERGSEQIGELLKLRDSDRESS